MRFPKLLCIPLIVVASQITSCKRRQVETTFQAGDINMVIARMTNLMLYDVTNPPLASRFFAYASLAGYEVVVQNNSAFKSLSPVLKNYPDIQKPAITGYAYRLAALYSMLETASKMQPSGRLLDSLKITLHDRCIENGMSEKLVNASQQYGISIAQQILKYAASDNYRKISNLSRYSPVSGDAYWYPTPPGFMAAVEPEFKTVRTFYLDSSLQFKPAAPVVFSSVKGSPFYKLMEEVYSETKNLSPEHRQIANFWDCNPFALQDNGHLEVGVKKISPGAHWMSIAGNACINTNTSFDKTTQLYAVLSTTLMDAFISCWDEKYRSNRIRPETAIRKYIDPDYQPLLQTPPFPEYLSGHSVISAASAEILSHYFGDNFTYTDSTETAFGLPARKFTSFRQAASEAAISRFYGGIHFMDAIMRGKTTGEEIGKFILKKLE